MPRMHNAYMQAMFKMMHEHGPFNFHDLQEVDKPIRCEACGQSGIKRLFVIQSKTGNLYRVGVECQEFLLPVEEAYLSAKSVRKLPTESLQRLADKYGVVNIAFDRKARAEQVIDARRKFAAKAGWDKRRSA